MPPVGLYACVSDGLVGFCRCLNVQISQTADEFGSIDRTATYRYPEMTKTMVPKVRTFILVIAASVGWVTSLSVSPAET